MPGGWGERLKRILFSILLFATALLAMAYIGDYAVLRYRVAKDKNPFGQVTVRSYYALHLKNGKTEYNFQPPRPETCANSLFPHLGMNPCWYLRRHREKRIDI